MKTSRRFVTVLFVAFLSLQAIVCAQSAHPTDEQKRREVAAFLQAHQELASKFFDLLVVMETVKSQYVDPKTSEEVLNMAIKGMAEELDPYSDVYIGKEAKAFYDSMREITQAGVGMTVQKFRNDVFVMSVVQGSPAGNAGLEPGDAITGVNGEKVFNWTLDQVVAKIRGEPNTTIELEISSSRFQKPQVVRITRQRITYPSVSSRELAGNVGYIKIDHFEIETPQRFREQLRALRGVRGLIIDLRGNPGGLLSSVVQTLGYFVGPDQTIIVKKEKTRETKVATVDPQVEHPPNVVILINNFSASASEIMAGNMKHYKAATLIGMRTFGKALVQSIFDMDKSVHEEDQSNLILKITTARYVLPNGQDISKSGVDPDIEVEQAENFRLYDLGTERDLQFQRALEFLRTQR